MFAIYAFGHGGGVPGPVPNTFAADAGNTNFAIIPNLTAQDLLDLGAALGSPADWAPRKPLTRARTQAGPPKGWVEQNLLAKKPYVLIDCGVQTAMLLSGSMGIPAASQNCKGIFLTHAHDDHSGGIKSLGYRFKYYDKVQPMLAFPKGLEPLIWAQTAEMAYHNPTSTERGLEAYYNVWLINEFGADFPVDDNAFWKGMTLIPFGVDHNCFDAAGKPFPAYGYKLMTPNRTIVFSGDTAEPLPTDLMDQADLVIHDVQMYSDGAKGDHVHCPYAWLRDTLPTKEARAKVMLTHMGGSGCGIDQMVDGFNSLEKGTLLIFP